MVLNLMSSYPVILSLENHCSVEQQIVMAKHLKEILGSMLWYIDLDDTVKKLPSPEKLRGKIIVKVFSAVSSATNIKKWDSGSLLV